MADSRIPAYDISLDKALKQGGFYGTNGVWNSLVKVDGRVLRGRVEVLVFKKKQQQIFMHIKNYDEKKYRIPGGSYEKDTPNYIQAQNEVNEEARIKVKNLVNTGEHYVKLYKNPAPLYGSNFTWVGNYTEVYIGEYDGVYTGKIADEDKDENMYKYGKFYDISEVYPIMNDVHKKIIDSIFPSLNNGNISESMIMLEEAKSEPHYYPYYTPFEMSKLGVFNENINRYSDIQDEAIEWYLEYTDSLRNPDSENWLKELQYRYDTYKKEPTAENKQLILHLGWNPEIPATIENVLIASGKTEKRLNESTDEKLVLDEGLIFSEKDIVLNIDDFESGKSNILFITGLAGSGKTTLAGTLEEQYGAEVVSLDYFQHEASFYNGYFKEFKDTISYKLVDKYMKENPDIAKSRDSFNGISLEDFGDYFVPFFGWLVNTLRKNKDKKYIVEGIHILLFIPYKDISSYPLYCVNTSAIKSLVRHWKRDEWTIKDIVEHGYGDLLKFKNWNDQYNRFKYGLKSDRVEKSNMLKEAMIYDPIGGGYIKSPFTEKDFVCTADMINNKLKKYHQEGEYMCIQPRDVESDDGGWIFAEYKILEKNDELNVVNFINEMNNWINNSILVGEVEMPEYIKEKGFLILRDSKKFLGETTILDESFLKNNEDFYYNIDKVDNGTNKVIYVTGHSGSGKSTLLKELNERYPNLIGISGDYIVVAILRNLADEIPDVWDLNKNKVKNKIGDIPYSFLLSNQSWKNISLTGDKSKDFNNPEIAQYFYDFIIWLENESKKSKYNNNIFAVEGLQVITVPDLNFYNDKPLIIKGTSALTSYMRKQKRDLSHDTSWDKIKNSIIGMIPKYIAYNADMNNLQRIMGESSTIQESQAISRKKVFDDSVKLLKKEMAKYPLLSSVVSIETHGNQWVKDFVNNKSNSCMIAGVSVWDVIPNARENADMIDDKVSKPMENIVKELNKKSPQGYYFDIDGDWDYYMININADETLNESVIHEISSKSYYRVTFHNTGIYEALKRILTKDEWELLLTDPGITWLPKPPKYAEGYVSYFTAYGYKMFETHTYPLIEKYFDDDITVVQIKKLDSDSIIYRDKYQVVVDISISESCKNVKDARNTQKEWEKEYGLPKLKKYPMPDEKHVLSAIRFFNYVSPANEEELARNIKKKMKQYDIPPSKVGDKNRLKKYLKEDADIVQELQVYCTDEKCKPVLLFDMGSVLVDSKKDYLDSLYNSSLIPDKLVQEIHDYIMDTYKDNTEYLAYCTTQEYYKFMTENAPEGLQKYIPAAININVESLKKLPYTDNLLKRLKDRGYTICYLSNWDRWSRDELVKNGTFDFLKYFDNGIFSCDVKCLKPDHKIYNKFLELCDKTTNNIIFFDDRADNIRAAMEVGMYGILFDKDYTPQYICDTFLSGEPIEEMVNYLNEEGSYNIEKTKDTYMMKNEKGQVISKIKYFDYKMKDFNWVLIADVETNPSYRKMGLASKLLNEVYKDVKEESDNKKGIYVFVRQNNKNAIALYKKLRFSTIKEYKLSDGDYFIMAKGSADKNQFNNMNFK